jgi:hypothetical protein
MTRTVMTRISKALLVAAVCGAVAPAFAAARMVPPERLGSYWKLMNTQVDADVPNTGRNLSQPGCASVSYTIGSDGLPRDIVAKKIVPDGDLGLVAVSIVKNFRYAAMPGNSTGEPVSTYYVVSFNLPTDPAQRDRISKQCVLPGYDAPH